MHVCVQDVTVPLDDVLRLSRLEDYGDALRAQGVHDIPQLVHFVRTGGGGSDGAVATQLGMGAAEAERLQSCTAHWAKALATLRKIQIHSCRRFEELDARRFRYTIVPP